jgi:hypothetical protein
MLMLTGAQKAFLERAIPRVLKEVECFKDIEYLDYNTVGMKVMERADPQRKKDIIGYRQSFLIYSFVTLTGTLFFISNSLYADGKDIIAREKIHPTKKKEQRDELLDKYLDFCKEYGKLLGV